LTLHSALELAAQGFRVFPLTADSKIPPRGFHWKEEATSDPDRIRQLWATYPDCNVAVATGAGTIVLDVDVKNGKHGHESLESLEAMGLPLDGFRARTASGGVHVYLKTDHPHANSVNKLAKFPDIDIRCEGGYVVGPGSTIGGKTYDIVQQGGASLPGWLHETLLEAAPKHTERTEQPLVELDLPRNVANAIEYLEKRAPEAIERGDGNDTTYKVAARMRSYGLSESKAWELMLDHWNEQKAMPVWSPDELLTVVQNAYRYATGGWGADDTSLEFQVVEDIPAFKAAPSDAAPAADTAPAAELKNPIAILKTLSFEDMQKMQEPEWLVAGVLIRNTSALMFGKSNTFKSFTAIDLALSVGTGREWHGCAVQKTKVLLVATEGANGVGRLRVPGWYAHYDVPADLRENVRLYPQEISLDVKENVDLLIATMKHHRVGLLVLDIFGGTMNGTEVEDTTAREWSRNIQRILRETGATVLTVAHTGWADETRARMHTHFWGSFDTRLKVEGDKDKLISTTAIERHKDADSAGKWGFRMEKSNGTLIPVLDDKANGLYLKLTDSQKRALAALEEALDAHGANVTQESMPVMARVVLLDAWRDACERHKLSKTDTPDAKRKAFSRAKKDLIELGIVGERNGWVWNQEDED
jgi:hypothetical protein